VSKKLNSVQSVKWVKNVQCTMYNVQCTLYNVQCTMYNVQCTMYNIQCTMYYVQMNMYFILWKELSWYLVLLFSIYLIFTAR